MHNSRVGVGVEGSLQRECFDWNQRVEVTDSVQMEELAHSAAAEVIHRLHSDQRDTEHLL